MIRLAFTAKPFLAVSSKPIEKERNRPGKGKGGRARPCE